MANYYKNDRRAETIRNRILVVLLVAVLVLVGVIAITKLKQGGNDAPSRSSKPETSSAPQSEPSSVVSSDPPSSASSQPSSSEPSTVQPTDAYYEEATPVLANPTNKIPEGYDPDVVDLGNGMSLNRKAAVAYNEMLRKANKDGLSLWLVSAYRSTERQVVVFNNKVKEYEAAGKTYEQAYAATATHIAVPGTSEHSLGLAADINSLETSFEDTKEFKWLIANCADFGFILRYPKDKVDITQITFEPWHYRYVGTNHAKIIMEKGICLEEYLSGSYQ